MLCVLSFKWRRWIGRDQYRQDLSFRYFLLREVLCLNGWPQTPSSVPYWTVLALCQCQVMTIQSYAISNHDCLLEPIDSLPSSASQVGCAAMHIFGVHRGRRWDFGGGQIWWRLLLLCIGVRKGRPAQAGASLHAAGCGKEPQADPAEYTSRIKITIVMMCIVNG